MRRKRLRVLKQAVGLIALLLGCRPQIIAPVSKIEIFLDANKNTAAMLIIRMSPVRMYAYSVKTTSVTVATAVFHF